MDAALLIIGLVMAGIGYGIGFFSCALLSMGYELEGEAARHVPACAVIEALSKQVRRYRLAVVWVFVLMFIALLLAIGSNWS
ncbi:hypothetical protein [Methylomonas sp. 11b]|uniref:hypothetical protein n=1 Tax=Methylomonas sp. 11b TaxID=1168169 RepID=UPI00047962AC|nr:hypothetical protein [Methylomonas sp. 11b]